MAAIYNATRPLLPDNSFLAGVTALVLLVGATAFINVLQQLVSSEAFGHCEISTYARPFTLRQLFPAPKSQPPVVFHVFPVIGSAVTYGMDPYKFLFDCREKVRTAVELGKACACS